MEQNQSEIFNLSVTPSLRNNMFTIVTWAKLCAICGFVSGGLSLISGIKGDNLFGTLISTAIGVFLNILLLNFATKLSVALNTNDEGTLVESFSNLRRYYLITGILMIIVSVIIVIALVALFAFAATR